MRDSLASDAPSALYSSRMTKIEKLEHEVRDLTPEELAQFREWFAAFDAAEWDRQFEADVESGKLDALANAALADHRAGRSKKL
jgi:hypothetical protein